MKKRKLSKNRDIGTTEEVKASFFNKKNIGLFVVGGLVFLMIFSIFAISLDNGTSSNTNKFEYNGYSFIQNNNGLWDTNINGANYQFEYNPEDVENIQSIDLRNINFQNKVYIIFNPDEFGENSQELLRIKQFFYSRGVASVLSCIKEQGCGDLPIADCSSGNNLYFKNGNNSKIYQDGNCLVLDAKPGEEPLIINRFIYGLLGVING